MDDLNNYIVSIYYLVTLATYNRILNSNGKKSNNHEVTAVSCEFL